MLGTNQSLEKSYLRLTTLPRSSEVRPPEVLALALTHVRRQVCADAVSLAWAADQLKAVRQDLLVQREVSSLTWDSYVASGRVAVQVQDWAELRQCLAALRDLDAEGLGGEEAAEFQGYALLLAAAGGTGSFMLELQTQVRDGRAGSCAGRAGPADFATSPARSSGFVRPSKRQKRDVGPPSLPAFSAPPPPLPSPTSVSPASCRAHSLASCRAFFARDHERFARLRASAPRMAPYLLDPLAAQLRSPALGALRSAFRPAPSGRVAARWLGEGSARRALALVCEG